MQDESHYETWVLRLRAWSQNPYLSLDDLPPLKSEDLPMNAWSRLVEHIVTAQHAVMQGFKDRFSKLVAQTRNDFEFSQALWESRRLLRHRVELANHPSLPVELRTPLQESCAEDIQRIQREVEEILIDAGRKTLGGSTLWAQRLLVVRQNPLTAVLRSDGSPQDGATGVPLPPDAAARPRADESPTRPASRWAHRRLQ